MRVQYKDLGFFSWRWCWHKRIVCIVQYVALDICEGWAPAQPVQTAVPLTHVHIHGLQGYKLSCTLCI